MITSGRQKSSSEDAVFCSSSTCRDKISAFASYADIDFTITNNRRFSYLLSDFGICINTARSRNFSIMEGDCRYSAPELLNLDPETTYLHKADIYAFGMLLLQLLSGQEPPTQGESAKIFRQEDTVANLLNKSCASTVLKGMVIGCLDLKPDKRPEAKDLLPIVLRRTRRLEATTNASQKNTLRQEGHQSVPSRRPSKHKNSELEYKPSLWHLSKDMSHPHKPKPKPFSLF